MLVASLRPQSSGPRVNAINIALVVKSFEDHPSGRAVRGTHMATGQEVLVSLSSTSKSAESKNRHSVADFEKGYQAFGKTYKVVPGGVLTFTSCYQNGENEYSGNWCNRLASDAEEAKDLRGHELVTLRKFGSVARANLSMKVSMWRPEKRVEVTSVQALHVQLEKFVDGVNKVPGGRFDSVIRTLNAKGEVTSAVLFHCPWNKGNANEAGRVMNGAEAVKFNTTQDEAYKAFLAQVAPGQVIEVIPAVTMSLSPLALDHTKANNQVGFYTEMSNRFVHEGQMYARYGLVNLASTGEGATKSRLAASLMVEDPWGDALDPALVIVGADGKLTERSYAPELLAAIEAATAGNRDRSAGDDEPSEPMDGAANGQSTAKQSDAQAGDPDPFA